MKRIDIEIYSMRLNKWLMGLSATIIVFGITMGLALLLAWIDSLVSAEGQDIGSFAGFKTFMDFLFIVMVFCSMAIATLLLYNCMLLHQPKMPVAENASPLRGEAIAHEKEIIELLKTVTVTLRYYSAFYKNLFEAKDAFPFKNDDILGTIADPYIPALVVVE